MLLSVITPHDWYWRYGIHAPPAFTPDVFLNPVREGQNIRHMKGRRYERPVQAMSRPTMRHPWNPKQSLAASLPGYSPVPRVCFAPHGFMLIIIFRARLTMSLHLRFFLPLFFRAHNISPAATLPRLFSLRYRHFPLRFAGSATPARCWLTPCAPRQMPRMPTRRAARQSAPQRPPDSDRRAMPPYAVRDYPTASACLYATI